jgi:hypothetical protein
MATNPSVPFQPEQPAQPPQLSQEGAPLSEGQRLAYTFLAPSKTFTDLRRNASWWGPYLLVVIVSFLFCYTVDQKVGFRKVAENLLQQSPKQSERIESLPADQRERAMQQQTTGTKYFSYGISVIALLIYAIIAGVLFATVKFGANADVKFKTMFALVVYTRLPELFRALLSALSLLAGVSSDGFNIRNPLAVNPGYFIDPSGSAALRTLLSAFDIITFWVLILLSIGITYIAKVKRGTAFAIVFGWYVFATLCFVALAAATS